jgi:hypothetical protein
LAVYDDPASCAPTLGKSTVKGRVRDCSTDGVSTGFQQ